MGEAGAFEGEGCGEGGFVFEGGGGEGDTVGVRRVGGGEVGERGKTEVSVEEDAGDVGAEGAADAVGEEGEADSG